jgi:predicted metal-dependent HD superfamily phosphohydrolase
VDGATRGALRSQWERRLTELGCPARDLESAFAELSRRYETPDRHYHTLDHIHDVLQTAASLPDWDQTPALFLAVWFHDVIYDPRAQDNEEQSAAHAREVLSSLAVSPAVVAETERLILLTKRHQTTPGDRAGQILIDADLAILAAPPDRYDAYAQAIRREYAWVPADTYRAGRRDVLQRFLQRPRLYLTDEMFRIAETAARENLQREVASLT